MPFTAELLVASFGKNKAGIGTVGYRLVQKSGADSVARTTTGVVDIGGGDYQVANVSILDNAFSVQWDTGGGSPVYASEDLDPLRMQEEVQGKLPTNNIMGSAVKTDKDDEIDAILADTIAIDGRLPADPADQSDVEAAIDAAEVAIRGGDNRDLTELAGASFTASDSLHQAKVQRDSLQTSIDDIQNNTRFSAAIPILERPLSGTLAYKIRVNLDDTQGNPEDPDANTINVNVTNQAGASRNGNLSSTTMTRLAIGRYEVTYNVSSAHLLEELLFEFSYAENTIPFTRDRASTVVDASEVGFTAADRANLIDVLADTNVMEPIISTNLDATISSVLTAIGLLNNISIADVQTALTAQGYTVGRAALLDNLDKAITALNDLSIADVQTALTGQGYTSVRAALLDNLDGAISAILLAISGLNDLSQADVQAAMTAQGYTTVRAALIDNLDAAITSVLTAIGALNNLSQADVQSAMTAQGYTVARAAAIELSRKMLTNRLELADGSTDNWILYDDDDSLLLKFNVTDKLGSVIVQPPLFPARRTKGVTP